MHLPHLGSRVCTTWISKWMEPRRLFLFFHGIRLYRIHVTPARCSRSFSIHDACYQLSTATTIRRASIDFRPENFASTRFAKRERALVARFRALENRQIGLPTGDGWMGCSRTIEQPRAEGQTPENASSFLLTLAKILATDRRINVPLKALPTSDGKRAPNERAPCVFEKRIHTRWRPNFRCIARMRAGRNPIDTDNAESQIFKRSFACLELPTFPKNAINPCLTSINSRNGLFHFFDYPSSPPIELARFAKNRFVRERRRKKETRDESHNNKNDACPGGKYAIPGQTIILFVVRIDTGGVHGG